MIAMWEHGSGLKPGGQAFCVLYIQPSAEACYFGSAHMHTRTYPQCLGSLKTGLPEQCGPESSATGCQSKPLGVSSESHASENSRQNRTESRELSSVPSSDCMMRVYLSPLDTNCNDGY